MPKLKEHDTCQKGPETFLVLQENKVFTGIGARHFIGAVEDYNQMEKKEPPIMDESSEWKHVFIQSNSFNRILRKGTKFLYCKPLTNVLSAHYGN